MFYNFRIEVQFWVWSNKRIEREEEINWRRTLSLKFCSRLSKSYETIYGKILSPVGHEFFLPRAKTLNQVSLSLDKPTVNISLFDSFWHICSACERKISSSRATSIFLSFNSICRRLFARGSKKREREKNVSNKNILNCNRWWIDGIRIGRVIKVIKKVGGE